MSNTRAFTVVGVLAIAFAGLPDDASAQDEAAEAVNQVMQARAGSTIRPTRALLFQVGESGEPLMIRADPASDS